MPRQIALGRGLARAVLLTIALAHAAAGFVHGVSMVGLWGPPWGDAPLPWRVLDVLLLSLDLAVFPWLVLRLPWAVGAFFLAAVAQLVLFTLFRDWLLTMPQPFTPAAAIQGKHLDAVALFYGLSVPLGAWALRHLALTDRLYLAANSRDEER